MDARLSNGALWGMDKDMTREELEQSHAELEEALKRCQSVLRVLVEEMESGDEPGEGSAWYKQAKAALEE